MRSCRAGSAWCGSPLAFGGGARHKALDKPPRVILYSTHTVRRLSSAVRTRGEPMVAEVPGAIGQGAQPTAQVQGWPARSVAYYGLTVIILATALNFLDAQIFSMMAQHIKGDFHLTDEQLGFQVKIALDVLGHHAEVLRVRSEEHTSELQSRFDLVCRLLLVKK